MANPGFDRAPGSSKMLISGPSGIDSSRTFSRCASCRKPKSVLDLHMISCVFCRGCFRGNTCAECSDWSVVVWAELCEFYARVFHVRQPPVPSSDSQVREDLDVTATMGVRELATATVPSSEAQEVRGSIQSMPEGYTTHSPSQSLSVSHAPIDTQSFLYSAGDQHTYESRYASDWHGPSGHPAYSHQVRSPFQMQDWGTKQVDRPMGRNSFAVAPPQGGADKPSGAALPLLGRRHRSDCGPTSPVEESHVLNKKVWRRDRGPAAR